MSTGHFAAKQNKIPHVWHVREYGDLDFNLYPIPTKKTFQKALRNDTAIFITKDLAKYNHAEESNQTHIVYNGVRRHDDVSFIEKKEPYFLCASRVSPEKGHLEVCHAFSEFHKKNPLNIPVRRSRQSGKMGATIPDLWSHLFIAHLFGQIQRVVIAQDFISLFARAARLQSV